MSAPGLRTWVRRALNAAEVRGDRLLLALSGGGDSQVLLHAMAGLAAEFRLELHGMGVDHGLRAEAAAELDLAAGLCAQLGVPFARETLALEPGGNVQARARRARYQALERHRRELGAACLVTAHHARDRAETVLLRLLRGAPPAGLAVLPLRAGVRLHPLIDVPHETIEAHRTRHALPFAHDPSNEAPRYLRVRVRQELLPWLRAVQPRIDQVLCALAEAQRTPVQAAAQDARDLALLRSLPRATLEALRRRHDGELGPQSELWLPGGLALGADGPHAS